MNANETARVVELARVSDPETFECGDMTTLLEGRIQLAPDGTVTFTPDPVALRRSLDEMKRG